MSNAIINWRFGKYHFQILRDRPYIRFSRNPYFDHVPYKTWFEAY
jgi:hypothetical protein